MRPAHSSKPSYVTKVEKVESDARGGNVKVLTRWYYRPEEPIGIRRQFDGSKEVFLSDHHDLQSADTIEGKCTTTIISVVLSIIRLLVPLFLIELLLSYFILCYLLRSRYCKCEMPYNPDDLMVQCDGCADWFHPACIEMTPEEAKQMEHFYCGNCSTEEQKLLQNAYATSRHTDTKVIFCLLTIYENNRYQGIFVSFFTIVSDRCKTRVNILLYLPRLYFVRSLSIAISNKKSGHPAAKRGCNPLVNV
ncbi:putative [histone H3]-dimethyl-L-lysine(36) demethylase chromatin regulator PHD family [Helianthus annuus]|nr:putative [histone H3]-dimethyl-L-lysine(36) demethylase chromatin regulator PHD family [Helianthus annuus]